MQRKVFEQKGLNFITLTIAGWVDLFTRAAYSAIILNSLAYCREHKGLVIYAYVIMPSHLHLIVKSENSAGLSKTIQAFKSFTAKEILGYLYNKQYPESRREWLLHQFSYFTSIYKTNRDHIVWIPGFRPTLLFSPRVIRQKLNYIHFNPVDAKIVHEPEHYVFSSASNYIKGTGVFDVELLDDIWGDIGYVFTGY